MPQRPRSHVLAEEGDRALRDALPSEWVVRRVEPDYGIDWTVEIFEAGEAIGRSFHVQVRATDEPDLRKALGALRFPRATADYYREQTNPVLIVRYHAPSARLFARWFHAYNPRIARRRLSPDTKTVGFQLFEQDEAGEHFAAHLRTGLEGFLAFRSPELALPLQVAIAPTDAGTTPDSRRTALAMRQILSPVEAVVVVEVREPAPNDPSITIEDQRVVISLADVASVTLDRDDPDDGDEYASWAADLTIALAVALSYVGQANLAAQLGCAAGHLSRVFADLTVAMEIAGAMHRSQRLREAIALADALDESGVEDLRVAAFLLLGALLSSRGQPRPSEQRLALESGRRRVERRRAGRDWRGVAAESYNLAKLYKGAYNAPEAVRWFREAAENDATYLDRSYYHSDLAGALFESGAYDAAASHYRTAVETGDRVLDQALFADALLYAGRYDEARVEFDAYLARRPSREASEWRLKAQTVRLLIDTVGPMQERDAASAESLLSGWSFESGSGIPTQDARQSCEDAIALDACCGEAWFRLAFFSIAAAGSAVAGAPHAVAAAILTRHALPMWRNALLCTDPSDTTAIEDLFYAGYHLNGSPFIDEAVAAIDGAPHLHAHRSSLIDLLDETVVAHQQTGSEGILRFPSEDGRMTEIVFTDRPDTSQRQPPKSGPSWRPPPVEQLRPTRNRRKTPRVRSGKTHGRRKRRRKKRR